MKLLFDRIFMEVAVWGGKESQYNNIEVNTNSEF